MKQMRNFSTTEHKIICTIVIQKAQCFNFVSVECVLST